jgi:3-keto-L-gulonate-6-phosphate decarboxylase
MQLIDDEKFVKEIIENKSFIFLDNSRGAGKQDSKTNSMKKINKLLEKGINDIAVSGGFGPDTLDLYFDLREQYKINF